MTRTSLISMSHQPTPRYGWTGWRSTALCTRGRGADLTKQTWGRDDIWPGPNSLLEVVSTSTTNHTIGVTGMPCLGHDTPNSCHFTITQQVTHPLPSQRSSSNWGKFSLLKALPELPWKDIAKAMPKVFMRRCLPPAKVQPHCVNLPFKTKQSSFNLNPLSSGLSFCPESIQLLSQGFQIL